MLAMMFDCTRFRSTYAAVTLISAADTPGFSVASAMCRASTTSTCPSVTGFSGLVAVVVVGVAGVAQVGAPPLAYRRLGHEQVDKDAAALRWFAVGLVRAPAEVPPGSGRGQPQVWQRSRPGGAVAAGSAGRLDYLVRHRFAIPHRLLLACSLCFR